MIAYFPAPTPKWPFILFATAVALAMWVEVNK